MWNVTSSYRAGSLVSVSKELSNCTLYLAKVKGVRWYGGGTEKSGEYTFFHGNWNENCEFGTNFLCLRKIIPAVKRVEFVKDRM
jgi:hypothetical protein